MLYIPRSLKHTAAWATVVYEKYPPVYIFSCVETIPETVLKILILKLLLLI